MTFVLIVALALCCNGAMGRARNDQSGLDERLLKLIEAQKAEFKNATKNPNVQFTEKQLLWFYTFGQSNLTGNSRTKRSVLDRSKERREYRTLSDTERSDLHDAFNAMRATYIDGMSQYDIFVNMHLFASHFGAAFLGWHREYIWRMELALQTHNANVMLAYWDDSLDRILPNPFDSAIWTPAYFGNNDGEVTSGFASNWITTSSCQAELLRRLRGDKADAKIDLFNEMDVNHVLNADNYKDLYYEYDVRFESKHGGVHITVGGAMASLSCSPNDPVFWMHHAYVDCLWEEYRQVTRVDPEFDYPPLTEPDNMIGGAAQRATAPMIPFSPLINIHGLSNHYTNYYYGCAARPTRCYTSSDCESPLLYCDYRTWKCRAKARLGGDCTDLPHAACDDTQCPDNEQPRCDSNVCICQLGRKTRYRYSHY